MTPFDVTLDVAVLERLASSLELWSDQLPDQERRHLLALLGLGSTALGSLPGLRAVSVADETRDVSGFVVMSPSFADALSPAADLAASSEALGLEATVTFDVSLGTWEGTTSPRN